MSRFHQRLREDLNDLEFAEAFYDMRADIALIQVLEEARKALNVSHENSRSSDSATQVVEKNIPERGF